MNGCQGDLAEERKVRIPLVQKRIDDLICAGIGPIGWHERVYSRYRGADLRPKVRIIKKSLCRDVPLQEQVAEGGRAAAPLHMDDLPLVCEDIAEFNFAALPFKTNKPLVIEKQVRPAFHGAGVVGALFLASAVGRQINLCVRYFCNRRVDRCYKIAANQLPVFGCQDMQRAANLNLR